RLPVASPSRMAMIGRPRNGAPVAELVDAADSKSVARKGVLVRVRPGAPGASMTGKGVDPRARASDASGNRGSSRGAIRASMRRSLMAGMVAAATFLGPPAHGP